MGEPEKLTDKVPAVLRSGSAISPRPTAKNKTRLVRGKAAKAVGFGKPAAPSPFIAVARERKIRMNGVHSEGGERKEG